MNKENESLIWFRVSVYEDPEDESGLEALVMGGMISTPSFSEKVRAAKEAGTSLITPNYSLTSANVEVIEVTDSEITTLDKLYLDSTGYLEALYDYVEEYEASIRDK